MSRTTKAVCLTCNGCGYSQLNSNQRCTICNGTGLIDVEVNIPESSIAQEPQFDLEYSAPQCGPRTLTFEFSGYGRIDASSDYNLKFAQDMLLRLGASRFKIIYDDGTVITCTRRS